MVMKYKITIELENDAFQEGLEGLEISRLLIEIAQLSELQGIGAEGFLKDINGITVGTAVRRKD